jgi:hypothetical protein
MAGIRVEALAVDDKVGVWTAVGLGGRFGAADVLTVTKRTPTQAVLSDGSRWTLRGREVGRSEWSRRFLCSPDEARERAAEAAKEATRQDRIYRLRDTRWDRLSDETLAQVLALLKQAKQASS